MNLGKLSQLFISDTKPVLKQDYDNMLKYVTQWPETCCRKGAHF